MTGGARDRTLQLGSDNNFGDGNSEQGLSRPWGPFPDKWPSGNNHCDSKKTTKSSFTDSIETRG